MRELPQAQGFFVGIDGHVYTDYTCTVIRPDLDKIRAWDRYVASRILQHPEPMREDVHSMTEEGKISYAETQAYIARVRAELFAMRAKVLK